MNWDAIGAIGQMLGSLAVLITLVYLALQVRQNTLTHRATAHMGRYAFAREQIGMMTNPTTAALALKGLSDSDTYTEIEAWQCHSLLMAFIIGSEEMFWLHDQGSLDEDAFNAQMAVLLQNLGSGAFRASWETGKFTLLPAFVVFVEQKLSTLPRSTPMPFLEVWNSALRSGRAKLRTLEPGSR
jgi:hypothetical protein